MSSLFCGYREKGVGEHWLPPTVRGRELFYKYNLKIFSSVLSADSFEQLLGTLDLLDRLPLSWRPSPPQPLKVLDVGSHTWRYAPALAVYLSAGSQVLGVEVAGRRLSGWWYTREDQARYYAHCATVLTAVQFRYQSKALAEVEEGDWDRVFWFFPFLALNTHRAWGLSPRFFDPLGGYQKVARLLGSSGLFIQVNQGTWEWEEARQLACAAGLVLVDEQWIENSLHLAPYPLAMSVWRARSV